MDGTIVPVGYFNDPVPREHAVRDWLDHSLRPLLCLLEESIVNEFKLIPAMYSYDVSINYTWKKEIDKAEEIVEIVKNQIDRLGCEPLHFQVVINLVHPHIRWGTIIDLTLEKNEVEFEGELFGRDVMVIDPLFLVIEEPLSLQTARELVESVLIDLRINYVQNS